MWYTIANEREIQYTITKKWRKKMKNINLKNMKETLVNYSEQDDKIIWKYNPETFYHA